MKKLINNIFIGTFLFGCFHHVKQIENVTILPTSKVNWEKLNPARGTKSPQAGTLWGDRKGSPATGFLVKFVDGFSSPPHIHNVSYRGIVIDGLIHNDDPRASDMWMPSGSYWTQPAGEVHITSAKGKRNIAFIEIDSGPYLVKPKSKAFDNGERPFNIHESNIIWRNQGRYKITELWKNNAGIVTGYLLKFNGNIKLKTKNAKLVLITGDMKIKNQTLNPGSLVAVNQRPKFKISCESNDCILYLKSDKKFKIL